jgi:signal transduction histidine kinase
MLRARLFDKLDERRIRYLLAAFFVALAVPAVLLIAQAYSQLKWEAFRSTQVLAEDLAVRVDADLRTAVAAEEARSFGDYAFLVVEGDAAANFVQRSPLSAFPVVSAIPGALGYFQVDAQGRLTTPLLPETGVDAATYGITADEQAARLTLAATIREVLAQNRLVERAERDASAGAAAPARERLGDAPQASEQQARRALRADEQDAALAGPAAAAPPLAPAAEEAQSAFDRLTTTGQSIGRVAGVGAERVVPRDFDTVAVEASPAERSLVEAVQQNRNAFAFDERQKRTEQGLVAEPEAFADGSAAPAGKAELRVRTFESELDPFDLGLLDTGHLVMFRNVWRDGQRFIQGALIDRDRFIAHAVEAAFRASSLAGISDLGVAYRGATLRAISAAPGRVYSPAQLSGSLLHRARLSPPFGDVELVFNVNRLPRAAGSVVLAWVSVILAAVLCGGFFFMYRFAIGQVRLTRQQQDFVSAVSHELKTPLTSIRMYGEMLKAGWADEAKKQTYYDYIHGESERLSRLIENVLQLARLNRSSQRFDMKRVAVAELIDVVRSKVGTQVERSGFALVIRNDAPADAALLIDPDCFTQIVINLVDNALKFSGTADRKAVEIASRRESGGRVLFTVRDFGPGIPKGQMKKIFELFYRPENELTRETVGTGIGLALVRELTMAMGGRVDVRNCEPGAEFRLSFAGAFL